MGRATRWLRGLLGGGGGWKKTSSGSPPPVKEKKKWGFGRTSKEKNSATQQRATTGDDRGGIYRERPGPAVEEDEQSKHAIAVAAATAAVAEAAVAAAQAAAAVVRLTSSGRITSTGFGAVAKREEFAAIKIQSAFRGYLARRALTALRGLVKLQALVRGNIVRKQAAETLRCMQAMVRVQARARACRSLRSDIPYSKKTGSHHPGPPTPEKHEASIRRNASRSNRSGSFKRNPSKPAVSDPTEDRAHSAGLNWPDRWMEERYWTSRDISTSIVVGSGMDDERNTKILEIDTGKPHQRSKCRSSHHQSTCSTLASDINSRSFTTVQDSPTFAPSPSSVDMPQSLRPRGVPLAAEASGLAESPHLYSASSRPGSTRKGPFTHAKSDCSRSLFSGYSDYTNYMADTESSRAKARSHSAPRQRPEYEKPSSLKRSSVQGFGQQQQGFSGALAHRSSSLHAKFTNKAYPGSGRLDRLGMPLGM